MEKDITLASAIAVQSVWNLLARMWSCAAQMTAMYP